MRALASYTAVLALVAALLWQFPLFHIVRTNQAQGRQYADAFDARSFAESFWRQRLIPSLKKAPDVAEFAAAFRENAQSSREVFGRAIGIGRSRLFLLRGSGKIVSIDKNSIGVSLQDGTNDADLLLHTGLLFGNEVRDASGLLDLSNFPNSQHFNEISTELNRIVETRVLPPLRQQAAIGREIQFAGCAEISDEASELRTLRLIVLDASVR